MCDLRIWECIEQFKNNKTTSMFFVKNFLVFVFIITITGSLYPSWRLALAIAGSCGAFFLSCIRINMSLALVSMTVNNMTVNTTGPPVDPECMSQWNITNKTASVSYCLPPYSILISLTI